MAFAQTMAFMAQVQAQAMAPYTNYAANGTSMPQVPQPPSSPQQIRQDSSPQRPSGTKRKRNERAANWRADNASKSTQNTQQPGQKPQKAKAAPAPAVPSFGFSLPIAQRGQTSASSNPKPRPDRNRRKVHLGLTARTELDSESGSGSDEEVDEEAAFATNIKGMVFEHEGQTISLQTPAELLAWRKDRKKHYPTQQRIEQKAREAAEQRAHELEFLRRVKGLSSDQNRGNHVPRATEAEMSEYNKQQAETQKSVEQQQDDWDKGVLKRKQMLPQNEAPEPTVAEREPEAVDLGLGYGSETESDNEVSSELEESSVVSSSEESSKDSDSDDDDSDAAPEEQSSKTVNVPVVSPPEPSKPKFEKARSKRDPGKECVQWKRYGKCNYGDRCRWRHPPKEAEKIVGLYEKVCNA